MRFAGVALLLLFLGIVNFAQAADTVYCDAGVKWIQAKAEAGNCYNDFNNTVTGLKALLDNPRSLITDGFQTGGSSLDTVCDTCYNEFTELIQFLYALGTEDETCAALAGGFEIACVTDTGIDTYCGAFDIPNTCTQPKATCCVPALKGFLTAVGQTTLASFVSYSNICPGAGFVTPSVDTCVFNDGTQVTTDFTFRYAFECNANTVLKTLDDLSISGYTSTQLASCKSKTKLLISSLYETYVEEEIVTFADVCDSCTEVINALASKLAEYSSDPYCRGALGFLEVGCQYTGDSYCGDEIVNIDDNCTKTEPAACCVVEAYDYYTDALGADVSENAKALLAELYEEFDAGICGLTSSDLTTGISTCSLQTDVKVTLPSSDAFAISMHSIFVIVLVSIATALLMIA